MESVRLVQLIHPQFKRRVALVKEPSLLLLKDVTSVYELALAAIEVQSSLGEHCQSIVSDALLDYDEVYNGSSAWKLLPAFDHPDSPFGCLVSGTGLTHKNSALNRQMMHINANNKLTDSMVIYQWGVEGGFPEEGNIGAQPEWFYKGSGACLKGHGDTLEIPPYGNDGGEEPEIAGIYIIDKEGKPWRVGFATGNEFSDHVMEKKNYLYLAPSKLRQCSIGPELVVSNDFESYTGTVSVRRGSEILWSSPVHTGQDNMAHSLENLEYHHFKYAGHRLPLQAHVHFFGADAFSFGKGIKLDDGDVMQVEWQGMGRALKNTLRVIKEEEKLVKVNAFS
jgi:hypothetical protein